MWTRGLAKNGQVPFAVDRFVDAAVSHHMRGKHPPHVTHDSRASVYDESNWLVVSSFSLTTKALRLSQTRFKVWTRGVWYAICRCAC